MPSISPTKVMLWSYTDLMALRTICWLRRDKTQEDGVDIPRSTMPAVRRALGELRRLNLGMWTDDGHARIMVTLDGRVAINDDAAVRRPDGQHILPDTIDVTAPFNCGTARGPDLWAPRPLLRIVPAKLSGAPHLHGTRIPTEAIAALAEGGVAFSTIEECYPSAGEGALRQAIEFEADLKHAA